MECAVLGLRNKLGYAFVTPYGAELRKDQTLIVPQTKAKGALLANNMTLEQVGTVDKERLKNGSWEVGSKSKAPPAPVFAEKKQEEKSNKSMSGKKRSKNKKV